MVTDTALESLKGIADPTRREIVERLSAGGLSVSEVAAGLPMSRPAVSKHLRVLRELGLVVETRVGRRRVYELVAEPLEAIVDWLERLTEAEGTSRHAGALRAASTPPAVERRPGADSRRKPPGSTREPADDGSRDRWRSW